MHDIAPTHAEARRTSSSLGIESTDTHTCVTVHAHAHTHTHRGCRLFSWCTDFPREFPMQGESSVTQSGWTRTADPRELLPKILAKIFGKNRFGKKGFAKNLGKNSWQKKSSKNFLEQSSGKLPKMSRRHCSITACAGGYQSLSNFIQLRLRPFSTALMTLPRQAAARPDFTARGRPAATHVHHGPPRAELGEPLKKFETRE